MSFTWLGWALALLVVAGAAALAYAHLPPSTGNAGVKKVAVVPTPPSHLIARSGPVGNELGPCAAYDPCAYVPLDGVLAGAASLNGQPVDLTHQSTMALLAGQPATLVFTVTNTLTATFSLAASQQLRVVDTSLATYPLVWSGPVRFASLALGPLGVVTGTVTWGGVDSRGKPVSTGPAHHYLFSYNLEVQGVAGYTGWTNTHLLFPQVGYMFGGFVDFTPAPSS